MKPYFIDDAITLYLGDAHEVLRALSDESVNCVVTSPPYYGLRDYGVPGQYGLEASPAEYVNQIRAVFTELRRVLAADGTLWLNLGDTYASKANAGASVGRTRRADRAEVIPARMNTTAEAPYKSLLMIPERVAWALIEDGWTLRNRIVWHKPNAMPESAKDRLSARHEALFLFTRSPRYWFDQAAIREPTTGGSHGHRPDFNGRWAARIREANKGVSGAPSRTLGTAGDTRTPGDVWTIPIAPFSEAHFAVFPPDLAERCVLAGCRPGGTVLDPFCGSGTTGMVAQRLGRRFVGVDLSAAYLDLALRTRLAQAAIVDAAVTS